MSVEQIKVGQIQEYWNVSRTRILKYTVEMYHEGLNEHKVISAPDEDMVKNKANLQAKKWVSKWNTIEKKRQLVLKRSASQKNVLAPINQALFKSAG